MIVIVRIPTVPKAEKVLATFDAPDPWSASTPTRFELTDFVMVAARNGRPMGGHKIGLHNTRNGEDKLLPEALCVLWKSGEVRAEQLPQLLSISSARFRPEDSDEILPRRFHRVMAALFLLLALPCFVMAASLIISQKSGTSHAVHQETLASLSARPLRDYESIHTSNDSADVIASVPIDAAPPLVDKLIATQIGTARLVVVTMGTHHRLLWTSMPLDRMALDGVVWPSRDLGVNAAIDALAKQVPDLERDQVFGQMWVWTDAYDSGGWWLFAILGALFLGGGVLVHEIVASRQRRCRRDIVWLREVARKTFTVQGAAVSRSPR